MPEEDKPVKPKGVKGVSTVGGPSITIPDYQPYYEYLKPTTDKEKFLAGTTGSIASGMTDATIKTTGLVDARLASLYTPINLAKAIPDQFEREKYIAEHGSKMVQLLDPNKYGIKFNNDALDYSIFKAKNYDIQLKKFLDDLDENQGFLAALGNTGAKLVGKTATAVGGLIPLTYGVGAALFSWDSKKLFDNTLFDAWESADHYLDRKFAVYGGADYSKGDKSFFGRFADNPMKSINADIIPAAAFVAGAVLTEFAAGALTATTFGAAAPVFAANTARLAAQGVNIFSKGVRVARGLDTLSDFNNMRKIVDLTQKIRTGIGTATTMVRTAGYESSLIARDTQRRTELQGRLNYIQSNPELHEQAKVLAEQGYTEDEISERLSEKIDPSVLSRIDYAAEQAGELAWFSNVPLVGFSNIIQFGKSLNFSYRLGNSLSKASRINPLRGTVINEAGEMVSKASVATRGQKVLGYGMTAAKGGLTESFEEFSQGAMEQGYSDFYASQFKSSNINNTVSFIDSMVKATRNYWNSTEGKDSMTIGALMGMLGIPLPISIDAQTGKGKLGMQWYGGVYGEFKDLKKDIARDKEIADLRNKNSINPVLKNNFENAIKNMDIQDDMDEAIKKQDVFTFKNKEFEQYHTFVNTRHKNGVADTIYQDLDALDQMDLKTFNDQYAFKGFEFTAETKKEAIEKTRKQTKDILASHKEVETLFNDSRLAVDRLFNKKYRDADGKLMFALKKANGDIIDTQTAYEFMDVLQNELVYLHSTNKNLNKREKELKEQIGNLTGNSFNTSLSNKIVAKTAGVSKKDSDISIEYATTAREMYKAQLAELKESDPILYDLVEAQLKPLVQDLIKLNDTKAKNASLYNTLFTEKGARDFINLHAEYTAKKGEIIKEAILKKREEETAKARTSETVKKASVDEQALNGTNTIASNKAKAEMDAMNEALSNIAAEESSGSTGDLSELINSIDGDTILEQLEKSPALFLEVLEYLKNQGTPLGGISNIDQLTNEAAADNSIIGTVSNALMALREQYNKATVVPPVTLEYADTTDENDVTPSNNASLADLYKGKLEELNALSIFQTGSNVSEQAIIPVTHDKKINNGEVERDEANGKFKPWYFVSQGQVLTSDQPVDTALLNSPEFLNNEELGSKVVNATFKIADNDYNKTDRAAEDIAIDIYHNDVFIGRLPAFKEGMASHLLALRQAVVAQETVTPITAQFTDVKADIERRRQEKYNTQYNNLVSGNVLDNQGEPVYEEDKGIGANSLSTLTDKKYGHGHIRTSGLNSLKVLEDLLEGGEFSGMFGQIGQGSYSTWESGKFIIVSNNINPTKNNKLNLNEIEIILNAGLTPFAQELANKYPNVIIKDFNGKKYDAELAALGQPSATNAKADIENKIKAFNKSIENEFEEGDYNKVLTLAEKQVKDGTIPQTPANIQLLTNYPKLFEELIKATDARNKTIAEFDKEKVLAGIPNKLPIYGIKSTINPATGRLDIKWIEVNKEVITNIQLTKIGNYAAEALFNYKSELQKELTALGKPTTQQQTVEQEVEVLRAKEQEEIKAKFPDAEYKADGKIDVSKLSAKDKKVYKDIYKRYDALITPRLEQAKKDAKEIIEKNFEDIAIQLANSKDERFFNENNEFKKCK